MSCSQYHGAVERLYASPFFAQPEHHRDRKELHKFFKTKTWPECLETEA
jgi:hypothetical protein